MAEELAEQLAGTGLDSAATTLSFANRNLKLDTEEDAREIVEAMNAMKDLRSLVLEGNTLGIGAARAIGKALERHPEIQQIHGKDLFTGRLKTEIPQALTFLGSGLMLAGARLTVLDLSDNAVGPVGMDGLHVLLTSPVCYSLQRLLFNNNGWGPTGGRRLADCLMECHQRSVADGSPMQLKEFVSGRSRLENGGAFKLAEFFRRIKTMERVVMPQNGIYHQGVRALVEACCENPALQQLDINDNTLTPKGARVVAELLPRMTELRILNLSDCLLKNSGARTVCRVIKNGSNPKLEEWHMGFNELTTEAALEVLETATTLEHLTLLVLDGNQLGEEGIETVQERAQELNMEDCLSGFSDDEDVPDEGEEENEEEEEEDDEEEEDEEEEDGGSETHVSPLKRGGPPAATVKSVFNSVKEIQEIKCTVPEFLCQPTTARLLGLGNNRLEQLATEAVSGVQDRADSAAVVRRHLEVLSAVCRVDAAPHQVSAAVTELVDALLKSALRAADTNVGLFSNTLLVYLGLIKCEDKQFSVSWDVKGMMVALTRAAKQPYFPREVSDVLQSFLSRPNKTIDVHPAQKHLLMQALYQ